MTVESRSVAIGPEFFQRALADYRDVGWAIVREFAQNGIDCGSKVIKFDLENTPEQHTRLVVSNDGAPMDRDTLLDRLLSLGGSGKTFTNTVGGFGKAKEVLYFAHRQYVIRSGWWLVTGSGAAYTIEKTADFVRGTRSEVIISKNWLEQLRTAIRLFVSKLQWSGSVLLDGAELDTRLNKGSFRRELEFGRVYTNRSDSGVVIIRQGGIPMFESPTSLSRCVVVELSKPSNEVLTANRDGLRYEYSAGLQNFLASLATDARTVLKHTSEVVETYDGYRLVVKIPTPPVVVASSTERRIPTVSQIAVANNFSVVSQRQSTEVQGESAEARDLAGMRFTIANNTGRRVPQAFIPGSGTFSRYSTRLCRIWANCVKAAHELAGLDKPFCVGFVFDPEVEAQFRIIDDCRTYLINPCTLSELPKKFVQRFRRGLSWEARGTIVMLAVHEVVHGQGKQWHDEEFASELTDRAAAAWNSHKKFAQCFKV